jgi:IS30 family transposase
MSKNIKGNQKHMTFEDRYIIEKSLDRQVKFKEIAALLKKDPTTISKEVQKHRTTKSKDPALRKNKCAMLDTCTKTHLCQSKYCSGNNPCAKCKQNSCAGLCDEYVSGTCPKLKKAPYVCNSCNDYRVCRYDKKYYRSKYADDIYHEVLSASRRGINQEPEELHEIDSLVSPLLVRGQSIAHIYSTHSDEINCSRRTLYNYIDSSALTVRNIDLPRKVKYKPRRKHKKPVNNNQAYRIDRTYEDFQEYKAEHPDTNVVEMDTCRWYKRRESITDYAF